MSPTASSPEQYGPLLDQLLDAVDGEERAKIWSDLLRGSQLWQALDHWAKDGQLVQEIVNRIRRALDDRTVTLPLFEKLKAQNPGLTAKEFNDKISIVRHLITAAAVSAAPGGAAGNSVEVDQFARAFADNLLLSKVRTPVAIVGTDGAMVAALELETIQGKGETCQHPGDLLSTTVNENFKRAMSTAFKAALALASQQENSPARQNPDCHGRWRITDPSTGLPIASLGGPSAGGAAFYGWHSALSGTICDPGVIVVAEVQIVHDVNNSSQTKFASVDGVTSKVTAITNLSKSSIDTIITVSGKNEEEATAVLQRAGARNFRVIGIHSA